MSRLTCPLSNTATREPFSLRSPYEWKQVCCGACCCSRITQSPVTSKLESLKSMDVRLETRWSLTHQPMSRSRVNQPEPALRSAKNRLCFSVHKTDWMSANRTELYHPLRSPARNTRAAALKILSTPLSTAPLSHRFQYNLNKFNR